MNEIYPSKENSKDCLVEAVKKRVPIILYVMGGHGGLSTPILRE
jgi:hypothetical protein